MSYTKPQMLAQLRLSPYLTDAQKAELEIFTAAELQELLESALAREQREHGAYGVANPTHNMVRPSSLSRDRMLALIARTDMWARAGDDEKAWMLALDTVELRTYFDRMVRDGDIPMTAPQSRARKAAVSRRSNRASKKAEAQRRKRSRSKSRKAKTTGKEHARRSRAAKKAAKTRAKNKAKRSRSAKKAAATRRRNSR
jgi:hypothetical protein